MTTSSQLPSQLEQNSELPPIPRIGALYILLLFLIALGFYALLLLSIATYGWLAYQLVILTTHLLEESKLRPALMSIFILALVAACILLLFFAYATVRGFKGRPGYPLFGIEADPVHHQQLFTLVQEVADHVGAKSVDLIYLMPGANISAHEEVPLYVPPGFGKRKIVVGMALLSTLTLDQMRSVLAHEFGHFSIQNVVLATFIYSVKSGFSNVMKEMSRVRYYLLNPIFVVLVIYAWIYAECLQSFSRYKEYCADRLAVNAYGCRQFADALIAVHLEASYFNKAGPQIIHAMLNQNHSCENIYHEIAITRRHYALHNEDMVREILGNIVNRTADSLESHPSLGERLKKQNFPLTEVRVPELPRIVTNQTLSDAVPPEIMAASATGPLSAAEELFGVDALSLQASLSNLAREEMRMRNGVVHR